MPTGIGTGVAGEVFKSQSGVGSSIVPVPAFSNKYAMKFDNDPTANDQYLLASATPQLGGVGGSGPWTVSLWFYANALTGANQRILDLNFGGTGDRFQLYINSNDGIAVSGAWTDNYAAYPLSATTWFNVIYRYDGTNTAAFIMNGTNVNSKTGVGTANFTTDGTTRVGKRGVSSGSNFQWFNGYVDELSIWNKELSDAECAALYNGGNPVNLYTLGISSSLQHWWRMGDVIGPPEYPSIPDQVTGGLGNDIITNSTFEEVGAEIIQNGDFSELGSELIVNGDFATAGTPTTGSYSLGWVIASSSDAGSNIVGGELVLTSKSSLDTYPRVYATNGVNSTNFLTAGKTYKFTYTVSEVSNSPNLAYFNGVSYVNINDTVGTHTYYYINQAPNPIFVLNNDRNATSVIKLSNVSLKEVDPDGDWSLGSGWSLTDKATHSAGASPTYLNQTSTTTIAKTYKTQFTISGGLNVTNFIQVYGVATYGGFSNQYTAPGTYTLYFTADATFFRFRGTSPDNDISVNNVSVKEVLGDWEFYQGSTSGGTSTVMFEDGVGLYGSTGCVFTGDAANTLIYLRQSGILTIGKKYQVSFMAKRNGGTDFNLKIDNTPEIQVPILSDTFQPYIVNFEASTTSFVLARSTSGGGLANSSVIVDNIEVKEIGGTFLEMENMTSSNIQTTIVP